MQPTSRADETAVHERLIARRVPSLVRSLPRDRRYYEAPPRLSFLIATSSAVLMERVGAARFESLVVDVSEVFEEYVRRVLADVANGGAIQHEVRDGNRNAIPPFVSGLEIPAKPDYYFVRDGRIEAAGAGRARTANG